MICLHRHTQDFKKNISYTPLIGKWVVLRYCINCGKVWVVKQ